LILKISTLPRQSTPSHGCNASLEDLQKDGLKLADDCPICKMTFASLCQVGCHPLKISAGTSSELLFVLKFLNAL